MQGGLPHPATRKNQVINQHNLQASHRLHQGYPHYFNESTQTPLLCLRGRDCCLC